jgi:adenylate cyclase
METENRDRSALNALLREYNEQPRRRDEVALTIEQRFGRDVAILVLDSSGFTRSTRSRGIVPFLAIIERLQRTVDPLVRRNNGRVLRTEADNVFAIFSTAHESLACAEEIVRALGAANEILPAEEEVYVSMGLGYGRVLLVEPDDAYGDEMNLACKLGEDLAQREEILLTERAYLHVRESGRSFDPLEFTISGVEIAAYRLRTS